LAPKDIPVLDSKGLRKFAFSSAAIIILLFGVLIPLLLGFAFPAWPWLAAGLLSVTGAFAPMSLNPIYRLWMRFGLIMNRVTTPIILGLVFFVVFAPVALAMRLFGRDVLNRKTDDKAETYRVISTVKPKHKMERPF